ncbi:transposable element Tc3 transposase [Elysia marginata]|uniref:Transposable element Tc3 transposase n=1 Tax=Elysia marginata TaxID=1093978 RepID=A0AAV4JCG4_9GAST|nr:transposable element Tc3 transposase [Elysia marginata]
MNQFSHKVMVFAGVGLNNKIEIVVLDMKTLKVNSKNYISLLPSCHKIYPPGDFILQQDVATLHSSRTTQNFLILQGVDFIAHDDWSLQSPDLIPLDYAMWDSLAKIYMGRSIPFTGIELEAKKECWGQIGIKELRKSIAT